MSLPELSRAALPARDPRCFWVECMDAGASIRFSVYSSAIWGVWTHFTGRTKPCYKAHEFCEGGHDETTMRWFGYLFGHHHHKNQSCFVQLTTGAARQLFNQVAAGVSLRGMVIDVSRTQSKKGRVNVKVQTYMSAGSEALPCDVDPKMSLFKMWHVKQIEAAANLSLVSAPADIPDDVAVA